DQGTGPRNLSNDSSFESQPPAADPARAAGPSERGGWHDGERFWKRFAKELEKAQAEMRDIKREQIATEETCDKCGKPMVIKWGRFGRFLACTGYPDCKNSKPIRKSDGADLENGKVEVAAPEPTGQPCPKCGSLLVRRVGRFGPFVGCSEFPKCKYVQPNTTGVECPQCDDGELVEKRTKRGRIFYGCDRFPKCKFATWKKPVPTPCPVCDHPFLEIRRKKGQPDSLTCPNEDCDYATEPKAVEAGT
ncbi:MAG: topoisomerase DNA-binding C4 zinc finger domain-containing protein, partial [Acidobacteriota bacterium]